MSFEAKLQGLMLRGAAYREFIHLNMREPSGAELEEFVPKYEAAAKAGAFRFVDDDDDDDEDDDVTS